MADLLKKLLASRWGVAALFGGAAALVGAGVVPHDSPETQGAAALTVGLVGGGLAVAGKLLLARFGPKKDESEPKP